MHIHPRHNGHETPPTARERASSSSSFFSLPSILLKNLRRLAENSTSVAAAGRDPSPLSQPHSPIFARPLLQLSLRSADVVASQLVRPSVHSAAVHHVATPVPRRSLFPLKQEDLVFLMLRYAGYIDSASNLYEVPRPPRRGSHRPAMPEFTAEPWNNNSAPPPSLNRSASSSSPPLHGISVTPLTLQHSYLGKRPMLTASLSLTKEHPTGYDNEKTRTKASARAHFVARSLREQSSRDKAFSQQNRASQEDTNHGNEDCGDYLYDALATTSVKQELLPMRRTAVDQTSPCENIRDTAPLALADLMNQLGSRNGGRFSPTASILESYARTIPLSASCQSVQKRCMYPDCTKISVSRGLCRGHGGGRRCHFLGCSKSAQSRSNFCWAHGGGQRCDVPNCMRSRKSKRFCVAHVQFESMASCEQPSQPYSSRLSDGIIGGRMSQEPPLSCKQQQAPAIQRYLPSLGQALSSASRLPPNLPRSFST